MKNEEELETLRNRINNFMLGCQDASDNTPPSEYTYQQISKVECARYPTQNVETIKFYFRTKGSKGNNKPYTYTEELPVGTYNMICDWLYTIRTSKNNDDIASIFDSPKVNANTDDINVTNIEDWMQ